MTPDGPPPPARTRRRVWIAVAAAAAALAAGAVAGAVLSSPGSSPRSNVSGALADRTGGPAPAFSLADLRTPSRTVSLSDFRGRDLVLNFWASWCFPCQSETPVLESAYRAAHGAVQFVGVDTGDTRGAALAFASRKHVTYPLLSLPDLHGKVVTEYGLPGLPVTVFVSAQGTLLGEHIGQLDAATLRAAMTEAFGSKAVSG